MLIPLAIEDHVVITVNVEINHLVAMTNCHE